jgi:hypothetical protein
VLVRKQGSEEGKRIEAQAGAREKSMAAGHGLKDHSLW